MHLPRHQQMLRDHKKHGGVDAVMAVIAKENPSAFTAEALDEIRSKRPQAEATDAAAALA